GGDSDRAAAGRPGKPAEKRFRADPSRITKQCAVPYIWFGATSYWPDPHASRYKLNGDLPRREGDSNRTTMKWKKHGLIFNVDGRSTWHRHSALQPTPLLLKEETIRVFAGFRDEKGASRVGFVDLQASDPTK